LDKGSYIAATLAPSAEFIKAQQAIPHSSRDVLAFSIPTMKEVIRTSRLPNGLTVISDEMKDLRSATLGIFLRCGARHEPIHLNGITHFIEHALFKGTVSRSMLDIAREIDRLGGNLDAFTMHEETGFAIKVVDSEIENGFGLLADLIGDPVFDQREMKREQKVIIEEIKMTDDNPEEHLGDLFNERFFKGHPLGSRIAGTPKSVRTFNRDIVSEYHSRVFTPENLIIVGAGSITHQHLVKLAKKFFGNRTNAKRLRVGAGRPRATRTVFVKQKKELEQAHMILATPFIPGTSEKRYAADLLVNIIGGGTSSRLWQKVREERGLAYSVGASGALYQDAGVFSVYAGTSPNQVQEVVDIALDEMRWITREGVTEMELELAKSQSISAIVLGLEDSGVRAGTLARMEMVHGKQISIEESLNRTREVTASEVRSLARQFFREENISFAAIGDLGKSRLKYGRL